jgi:hypothetical protein
VGKFQEGPGLNLKKIFKNSRHMSTEQQDWEIYDKRDEILYNMHEDIMSDVRKNVKNRQ